MDSVRRRVVPSSVYSSSSTSSSSGGAYSPSSSSQVSGKSSQTSSEFDNFMNEVSSGGFSVIAEYFGKGLFNKALYIAEEKLNKK
jgi:hypothetical protein